MMYQVIDSGKASKGTGGGEQEKEQGSYQTIALSFLAIGLQMAE